MEAKRVRTAIILPILAFSAAALVAVGIGNLLHQVPHGSAPGVALGLTLLVTAAGFYASYGVPGKQPPG